MINTQLSRYLPVLLRRSEGDEMTLWRPRRDDNRGAIVGDDQTTSLMVKKLREVGSQPGGEPTNDLERAALALQMGAAQRIDTESRRPLVRAIFRVEDAEKRYRKANARVDQFKNSALASGLSAYQVEETKRARQKATKEIDGTTAQVPPLVVDLAEVVLLVAEFAFYYKTFGANTPDDAPLIDRLFIAFLAILVPVVGILSARFFAGAFQHLRAPREPGSDRTGVRIAYVLIASLLLGASCYATLRLVEWRYKSEAAENFGAVNQPPSTVMAIVFVAFILTDGLIRAFLFPPGKRTSIRRRWSARYVQALDWWFLRREVAALAAWQKGWFAAKALIEKLKNDADQQQLSATVVILMTRGELGRGSSRLVGAPALDGAHPESLSRGTGDIYVPHQHMIETDGYLYLPHRLIAIADQRLERIRPPDDPEQEQRQPAEDLLQWRLEAAEMQTLSFRRSAGAPPPHRLFGPVDPTIAMDGQKNQSDQSAQ